MAGVVPISDDPVIPFRVSHAVVLVMVKEKIDTIEAWAKVGVTGGIVLLSSILAVLLMR